MKDDALEDVRCPFNYWGELEKARRLLNKKVRECVFQDRSLGYRELAMKFKVSTGTLCAIVNKKQKWQPIVRRARVKEDAFDDLQGPFIYKKELKIARDALDLGAQQKLPRSASEKCPRPGTRFRNQFEIVRDCPAKNITLIPRRAARGCQGRP